MPFARWQSTIVDEFGNIVQQPSVEVRAETVGQPLATLYADRDGATPLGNPFTVSLGANGFAAFHVAGGAYQITVTKGAYSKTYRYVGIGTGSETDIAVMTPRGEWSSIVTFQTGDVVIHEGYLFASLIDDNLNTEPDTSPATTTEWMVVPGGDGPPGPQGDPGPQGIPGATGPNTGLDYAWATGTSGNPGSGNVLANNATLASATKVHISKTDRNGASKGTFIGTWGDSTNTHKGYLRIFTLADTTEFIEASVTGIVDQTSYWEVNITVLSAAGTPSAADVMSVVFTRTGDVGTNGVNGTNGTNGAPGANGIDGTGALTIVRAVAITNVSLSNGLENGDTVEGVALATGDLVLLTAQTAPAENGVYVVVASGTASRHSSLNTYDSLCGAYFSVMEGTTKADTLWRCTSNRGGTLGSTAVAISEATFGGSTGREPLSADRTYYVRSDGSDSNNGLANTSGGAFLTVQKAVDVIAASLDIAGKTVTVQIADGTYTGAVLLKEVVGYSAPGCLVIKGNNSTPANVVISTTSATCFTASSIQAIWDIKDLKVQTTTSGFCLDAKDATVRFGNLNFGASVNAHIRAWSGGKILALSDYAVTGGAAVHFQAIDFGIIDCSGRTVTFTGSLAFTWFVLGNTGAYLALYTMTFSGGTITGSRFSLANGSSVFTNNDSLSYFPGNSVGVAVSGARYNALPAGTQVTLASGSIAAATTTPITDIPTFFSRILVQGRGISNATTTRQLMIQLSTDNGSSYDTTAGNYTGFSVTGTTVATFAIASIIQSAAIANTASFDLDIEITRVNGMCTFIRGTVLANATRYNINCVYIGSTSAFNALRFLWDNTGNSDAGTYTVIGVA